MSSDPNISFFKIISPIDKSLPAFLSAYEKPFFSLVRAEIVKTRLQVQHAYRISMEEYGSQSRIEKPESIFLMLLSGRDQIKDAIETAGIDSTVRSGVAIYDDRNHYRRFLMKYEGKVAESFEPLKDDDRSLDSEIFPKMTYTRMKIRL
ncbi:MAG: hypothetical protein AAE983_01565 [Thermoplasmataceae archaeon]|jgi:tRNA threonylcarbamoyladenosine modification (KEOPS) complex Cgi121 subunit